MHEPNHSVSVAGLNVNTYTKAALLEELGSRLRDKQKTFITTVYSEFLYAALRSNKIMELLNIADIAVPDGIAILWAQYYLERPFAFTNYYIRIIEAWLYMMYTGAQILLSPRSLYAVFPEKIVGADLIWDLAQLSEHGGHTMYLLGGWADTPARVAAALKKRYPGVHIVGTSSKNPDDASVLADIAAVKPDMILVAYGPLRQEQWIVKHKDALPTTLMIGLGGTFDYVAGDQTPPPSFLRSVGLEWLYRLVTQPHRFTRIKNGTVDLVMMLIRYRVFHSLPYRRNVVVVAFNDKGQVLLCKRRKDDIIAWQVRYDTSKFDDYWQFPQGGLEKNEDIMQGALREASEEIGTDKLKSVGVSEHRYRYEWNNGIRPFFGNNFHYRGQEQRLAYFQFTGEEKDIVVDNVEFIEYKWVDLSALKTVAHAEKHALVDIVISDVGENKVLDL